MTYNLTRVPINALLRPISEATAALVRLDERLKQTPLGPGCLERLHFHDACASLWIDGELVHLEDLVLHESSRDIRSPTHELTIAHAVLRARRKILRHPPGWALTPEGFLALRGAEAEAGEGRENQQGDWLSDGPGTLIERDDDDDTPLVQETVTTLKINNVCVAGVSPLSFGLKLR